MIGWLVLFTALSLLAMEDAAPAPYMGQEPPGVVPKVFAPGLISLPNRCEHDICFSSDWRECYFTVRTGGWKTHKILIMRYQDGRWKQPVQASFSDNTCLSPGLADNDQSMYFSGGGGLWKTERLTTGSGPYRGWSRPKPVPAPISPRRGDWGCHISNLGNLWFCSWRPGGLGKCDLWFARSGDGQFKEATNLRDLNTTGFDCYPVPGPDERYCIWISDRPGGCGQCDLYISFADNQGGWTAPGNLGAPISTSANEAGPYVSPDYKYLFFSRSDRSKGDSEDADIYWVSVRAFLPDPNGPDASSRQTTETTERSK